MNKKNNKIDLIVTIIFLIISLTLIGLVFYKMISEKSFDSADNYSTVLFIVCIIYALYKYIRNKKERKFYEK